MAAVDLVVVGAGHAGCEAALAAARMGARVLVVTLDRRTVGRMPCNPAVGGVGKGHLVAEVDALGGVQGWAADRAGLQFRVLNRTRGPAVWGPRAQCDKAEYALRLRRLLEGVTGISILEGEAVALLQGDRGVQGVVLRSGQRVRARATLLTTGTFLGGILHTGDERTPGGRLGEAPSVGLGAALGRLGLSLRRFKTGTPPRLDLASVDTVRLAEQAGEEPPRPFSWRSRAVANRGVCWITRTPPVVQRIIGDNLHRSPLFAGAIAGVGPRYCPSIEDKVVRFPHHEEHTLFLEPEGVGTRSLYVNGLSTSLPRDVQEAVVRVVPGLEGARFLRYGYAVEYDAVPAVQMERSLGVRGIPGLYLAGQLLGTSGYEEAAALGLLAGVNAVLALRDEAPLVLGREEAYLGVMVDDLISRDHPEPYRMLTARAEHRLVLGVDSARERLLHRGVALGLVPQRVFHVEQRRWAERTRVAEALEETRLNPDRGTRERLRAAIGVDLRQPCSWADLLRRPEVELATAAEHAPWLGALTEEDRLAVAARVRYGGYLDRARREVERVERLRDIVLPDPLDADLVRGLAREAVEALQRSRPRTLAQAERLPGLTAAAVAILAGRLARRGAA